MLKAQLKEDDYNFFSVQTQNVHVLLFWKYFFQLGNFVGSFVEMGSELAAKAKALGMKFTQASMYQINLNGVPVLP